MENNQQNAQQAKGMNNDVPNSPENQKSGGNTGKENETESANRFAETANREQERSQRGSRSAENETIGTP